MQLGLALSLTAVNRMTPAEGPGAPVSYDVLVSNLAELRALNVEAARTASGKGSGQTLIVALAPGNYFPGPGEENAWEPDSTYLGTTPGAVMFTGLYANGAYYPVIDRVKLAKSLTVRPLFRYLHITCRLWAPRFDEFAAGAEPGEPNSIASNLNGSLRVATSTGLDAWCSYCIFSGNYRGDHTHIFDVTDVLIDGFANRYENRYPENAHIMPASSGGTITNLYVPEWTRGTRVHTPQYVGDNCDPAWLDTETGMIADGEHPLFIHPSAGGSGFEGYMITTDGRITGFNLVNGGTGYTTAGLISEWWVTWLGRKTLNAYCVSGAVRPYGGSGGFNDDARFEFCTFRSAYTGIRMGPAYGGTMLVKGCVFDRLYADGINCPQVDAAKGSLIELRGNLFKELFAASYHPQNSHSDNVQLFFDGTFNSPVNVLIAGNVLMSGDTAGDTASGIITTDQEETPPTPYGSSGYFIANTILTRTQGNCLSLEFTGDTLVSNNIVLRYDVDGELEQNTNLGQTSLYAVGPVAIRNNVMENRSIISGAEWVTESNNSYTGQNGATIAYSSLIADAAARPKTRAATSTAFATIGAAATQGPQAGGVWDEDNLEVVWANVPPFVSFQDVLGQDADAAVSTRWTRILGGTDTGSISVTGSGVSFEIADDSAGTGATSPDTSYSGAVRDKWIRLTCAAVTTGLTTVVATLNINGTEFTWRVTTAPELQYNRVDNGAAAYGDINIPNGQMANADRVMIAFGLNIDEHVVPARLFTGTGSGASILSFATGGIPSLDVGNSGTVLKRRPAAAPTLDTWQLWVLLIDLSTTDQAERLKWMVNTDLPTLNPSFMSGTGASVDMRQFWCGSGSNTLRMFADADANPIMDARFELALWAHWGRSADGFTLPDVSTIGARQALYNSFTRDLIGADGSGPLGVQPFLCFYGDTGASDGSEANTFNATGGLTNRGTISTALVKQAGTFTTV